MRGKEIDMATIVINAITHRQACTDSAGESDLSAYDNAAEAFFDSLGAKAKAAGFGFEVDAHGQGALSYRVTDEADYEDLQAANDFMQSDAADFWAQF
jgi:hypothetical protein